MTAVFPTYLLNSEEQETEWDALARILAQSQHLRLAIRIALELPTARRVLEGDPEATELKRQMIAAYDRVVRKVQAEGSVRKDIGSGDVAVAFVFLARQIPARQIPAPQIESAPMATQRILALMLDAFRAQPAEPLPGRPLTPADLGLD